MSDDNDNDPPLPTLEECEGVVRKLTICINFLKRERLRSSMAEQRFCEPPVAGSSPAVGFLTDAERDALEFAVATGRVATHDQATLRSLLERLT